MKPFEYDKATALVTGASRGIGAALARELAARGIKHLVLTARTLSDLETLKAQILQLYNYSDLQITLIAADLSSTDAPEMLFAETNRLGLSVDLLVNNAGFGSHGWFDTLDLAREEAMLSVNIASLVKLTRLYLPDLNRARVGRSAQSRLDRELLASSVYGDVWGNKSVCTLVFGGALVGVPGARRRCPGRLSLPWWHRYRLCRGRRRHTRQV